MRKIFIAVLTLTAIAGCAGSESKCPTPASAPALAMPSADSKKVMAEIDGETITEADLMQRIAPDMARIQSQIYDMQKQGLDEMIDEKLVKKEAAKQGVSLEQLMKVEVRDKAGDVTDQEVEDFYNQNKPRFGTRTLDDVKIQLKQQLLQRKMALYQNQFLDKLKGKSNVTVMLKPPTVDVSVDDDPSKGSKNASVTIIEFTDYQCPFCGRARPTVKKIVEQYGDKIQYVLRDFPLEFHPYATKAAEAADCAGDQGKYWDYSDTLWANQGKLEITDLKKYAADLKLDTKKFDECLDKGKFAEEVKKDQADGAKVGVTGTPTFFVNGQMLTGALPIEEFQKVIDEQLKNPNKK